MLARFINPTLHEDAAMATRKTPAKKTPAKKAAAKKTAGAGKTASKKPTPTRAGIAKPSMIKPGDDGRGGSDIVI